MAGVGGMWGGEPRLSPLDATWGRPHHSNIHWYLHKVCVHVTWGEWLGVAIDSGGLIRGGGTGISWGEGLSSKLEEQSETQSLVDERSCSALHWVTHVHPPVVRTLSLEGGAPYGPPLRASLGRAAGEEGAPQVWGAV